MRIETPSGVTELWIDAEPRERVVNLLGEGVAVHANTLYRYIEQNGPPIPTEKLHIFMARQWDAIGVILRDDGLTLTRAKDPTGEPCYVAGPAGQTINIGFAQYKLW